MKNFLSAIFFFSGLLGFSNASIAGPKNNYSDRCEYVYENDQGSRCMTKKGRILTNDGKLLGYLGRDYVITSLDGVWQLEGIGLVRYEQTNKGLTLIEYTCFADSTGCTRPTKKSIFKYYVSKQVEKTQTKPTPSFYIIHDFEGNEKKVTIP